MTSKIIGEVYYNADKYGADFWTNERVVGSNNDIMVAPSGQELFEELLKKNNIGFEVTMSNFGK